MADMIYTFDPVCLWLRGRVSWKNLCLVLRTGQPAVARLYSSEIVCRKTARDFSVYEKIISKRKKGSDD